MGLQRIQYKGESTHSYKSLATEAAQLERDGRHGEAAMVWYQAQQVAKDDRNKRWALARIGVCEQLMGCWRGAH